MLYHSSNLNLLQALKKTPIRKIQRESSTKCYCYLLVLFVFVVYSTAIVVCFWCTYDYIVALQMQINSMKNQLDNLQTIHAAGMSDYQMGMITQRTSLASTNNDTEYDLFYDTYDSYDTDTEEEQEKFIMPSIEDYVQDMSSDWDLDTMEKKLPIPESDCFLHKIIEASRQKRSVPTDGEKTAKGRETENLRNSRSAEEDSTVYPWSTSRNQVVGESYTDGTDYILQRKRKPHGYYVLQESGLEGNAAEFLNRTPKMGRVKPLPSAHFFGDTSAYDPQIHEHYEGNGHIRHLTRTYTDWKETDWFTDLGMNQYFGFGDGKVTIKTTGLYFVYAQIFHLDIHNTNGFRVIKNDDPILQCTSTSHTRDDMHKGNTCFTAGVHYLQEGDIISLKDVYDDRYTLFENGKSFFGFIKLGDARGQ